MKRQVAIPNPGSQYSPPRGQGSNRAGTGRHVAERGVITSMFAVLAIFLALIITVVAEGGRKLENLGRAEDAAAEAARAAAATLDPASIPTGEATIHGPPDDGRARMQAELIVSEVDGASIEEFQITDDGGAVVVVVRVRAASVLPGFSVDGVGRHRATALNPFG